MKKYFLLLAFIIFNLAAFSQQFTESRRIDSVRLDSLKQMLTLFKGESRIDLMNEISLRIGYFAPTGGFVHKDDSIYYYASRAYAEAVKINYKSGIASSLLRLQTKSDSDKEKNIREAIRLGEEVNDNDVLGWAYYLLAGLPVIKNNFEQHMGNYKKSIYYFQKSGNVLREAEVTNWLGSEYIGHGNFDEGFEYAQKSIVLSKNSKALDTDWGQFLVRYSLETMGYLYASIGDLETAMDYALEMRRFDKMHNTKSWDQGLAGLYSAIGKYDSALYYLQQCSRIAPQNPWVKVDIGNTYTALKEYGKALKFISEGIDSIRKRINSPGLPNALLSLGEVYYKKGNYTVALKYAKEGFTLANQRIEQQTLIHSYELLSSIFHHLKKDDSAYRYLQKFIVLKDSAQKRQNLLRLNNYKKINEVAKKDAQLGLLTRDNKIKQQQLKQEGLIKKVLIAGLVFLSLIGIFIFRMLTLKRKNEKLRRETVENEMKVQHLENEKKNVDLQRQAAELEMQALRAQMNPHFIFNCLSSINRFILKNEIKIASNYLTRFSRLIRMVLMNSQKTLIALEDELQMLKLYLDMERLRFKDSFDYSITFLNTMDGDNIFIPPLLLQPFCENAIWHGLMNKEGPGLLKIELSMQDNVLHCTITDNGIGRQKAGEIKSKSAENKKSMGLKITTERLALLNREKGVNTFYEIEDLLDENGNAAGTRVNLKISYKESVEELA